MDQPYSFWADLLNKFHTSPEWIQPLWFITPAVTILGVTWLIMRGLTQALHWRGTLIYGVYQDAQGRWMTYWLGRKSQEIDWTSPPQELIRPRELIQGMFWRPKE